MPLTQELLSEMPGVRRSSVSEIAGRLQATGLIRYSQRAIEILNRRALGSGVVRVLRGYPRSKSSQMSV